MGSSRFLRLSPQTVIHYSVTQPPSTSCESPLLVFLHYWGGPSATWHKLTSPDSPVSLINRYPTLSIDLRGWGKSTGPTEGATARDYAITPMASDIVTLLDRLKADPTTSPLFNNGVVLVGHSMGAKVALATFQGVSDDSLGLVKGLVLVSPAPPTPLVLPADMSKQQRGAYATKESAEWTVQNILSVPASLTYKDLSIVVRSSVAANNLAKDGWILYGMEEDISSVLEEISSRPHGKEIKFSVLAGELDMVEQKDRVQREVVQPLTAQGFRVTFTVLKGVKHLVPLEDPVAVSRAIDGLLPG